MAIVHNIENGEAIDAFHHMHDVYALSLNPDNNDIFATASDDIRIWDLRSPTSCLFLPDSHGIFNDVMYNPTQNNILVTVNSYFGVELYDLRQPIRRLTRFYSTNIFNNTEYMSARFDYLGNKILANGKKQPLVLYDVRCPYPQLLLDANGYFNSCTTKNCSFAGNNSQFAISGSDNFCVYIWKIPDTILNNFSTKNPLNMFSVDYILEPIQVLSGHRLINYILINNFCCNNYVFFYL